MLVSIDPAKRAIYWAAFEGAVLVQCNAIKWADSDFEQGIPRALCALRDIMPAKVVVELPRVYPRDRKRPNDLIDLAAVAGACLALGAEGSHFVHPHQWKGQVPKEVMGKRVLAQLTDVELLIHGMYESRRRTKKPDHNILDAIGVGIKELGRL